MAHPDQPKIMVVGAGLSGALMAAYLGQAGYTVELFEKRPDPRGGEVPGGRSINLALSTRGIHPLEEVGVAREVLDAAVPMRGRMMHDRSGNLAFQPYGIEPHHVINSVSRAGLNLALLNAAERSGNVRLHFDLKCTAVDLASGAVEVADCRTEQRHLVSGDIVIGSDGAFSAVREQMTRLDRFDYQQQYLTHGYKELTIPPAADGGFRLADNALHIWPRGGLMMIALPNRDGSFTCTLFWPFEGPNSFAAVNSAADVQRFFEEQFPDALPHMPSLVEDYLHNPASSMVTIRCSPWSYEDKFVLLGDAAHAVVPFYGQGMNASFEDCGVLNACIAEHAPDWKAVFGSYHQRRKEHVDALADLALANFIEMRDHVASPVFLFKKRMERTLYRLFPRRYVPLYSLVTFSRMPYADAVRCARRQNRLVVAVGALCALLILAMVMLLLPQCAAPERRSGFLGFRTYVSGETPTDISAGGSAHGVRHVADLLELSQDR